MYPFYTALIVWACIGGLTAYFAKQRHRNPLSWFLIGLALGIFGFLLLFLLPSKKVEKKQEATLPIAESHNEAAIPSENPTPYQPPAKRIPTNRSILWYYLDENLDTQGPLTIDKLRKTLHEKKLDATCYIWCEEYDDWMQIQDCQNQNVLTDPDLID